MEERKNEKVKVINLTPHEVRLINEEGNTIAVFPSEGVVRLSEHREKIAEINNIPVYRKRFGSTELPQKKANTYYIVSLPVAQAFPERDDFLVPDQLVRDEKGRVIGARSFAIFSGGEI